MGLPVIAADSGGPKEIIKNNQNGLLIKPKNYKELAKKLEQLITNKSFYQKISKKALEDVKKYNSILCCKKVEKTLENLF